MTTVAGVEQRGSVGDRHGGFRPMVLAVLALPLMMSACASTGSGTTTASLSQTPPVGATDAFGYAPARILAFSDGSRVALPTAKPDHARLVSARAAAEAKTKDGKGSAKADSLAPAEPGNAAASLAALKADVAERKAQQASLSLEAASAETRTAKARVAVDAKMAPAVVPVPAAAKRSAEKPVVEAAKDAVVEQIASVGESAEAVTVAAIDTTKKAVKVVGEKLGDTFKGTDTITGDASIDRLIEAAAAENGIPPELAYAVVRVESHYNPKARGSGVYGLSQIKPATARGLGFSGPANALFDPETNLRYGMKYLAGAWQQGDRDVCRAAMKYKGGHRTTRMSRSAATYCSNVKRHMAAIERRRAPANRGVVIAANERRKQIAVASGQPSALALPAAARPVGPDMAGTGIAAAAASTEGRRVAATAMISEGRSQGKTSGRVGNHGSAETTRRPGEASH